MRISAALLAGLGLAIVTATANGQVPERAGQTLLAQAKAETRPLGVDGYAIFQILQHQSFENNVSFSNAWIKAQLEYFDQTKDAEYKTALAPMINGGADHGLGMRNWLTDPKNVGWWDGAVRDAAGDEGYARVVALNAAFAPGSGLYLLTYGYDRRYDAGQNLMKLNDASFEGVMNQAEVSKFAPDTPTKGTFSQLVKFGDPVRRQMFDFYRAYLDGKVTPAQVAVFNEAYIKSGGCALAATEEEEDARAQRYLNALNVMKITLGSLGYP
jgi:hypothetical protein